MILMIFMPRKIITKLSLRIRLYTILTALVLITLIGGIIMVWYTYQMDELLTRIIDKNVAAFQSAESLEIALVNQKGFVSYYFLDGDPDWLRQLGEYRQIFKNQLERTLALVETPEQKEAINRIGAEYNKYITIKDQVIEYYKKGEREAGEKVHRQVRDYFFKILDLCEKYKNIQTEKIIQARKESRNQAIRLRIIAGIAMLTVFSLAVFFAFVIVNHILDPIRILTMEAEGDDRERHLSENEINALSQSVRGLIKNAGQTHIELERSREHLLQSEKMALVGRLAASTAHSIRNPLTSVKMRLFSLSRSLGLSDNQKEDFDVISEEIRHIDTIVQNFLEFSRPPKLKMQHISPSVVVDMAIQLLEHRLKSYDVNVKVIRNNMLPEIEADPEQLKEVLVNLIVNACEAMEKWDSSMISDGPVLLYDQKNPRPRNERKIIIQEETTEKKVVIISVSDNGPGFSESIQKKIFEPFFTTKDEGTGLGLSIASRIIEEHHGWMDVTSKEGEGTTFSINLPFSI